MTQEVPDPKEIPIDTSREEAEREEALRQQEEAKKREEERRLRNQVPAIDALNDALSTPISSDWLAQQGDAPDALLKHCDGAEIGIYRGEVAVLVGQGGAGKSWFTLRMALAAARPNKQVVKCAKDGFLRMTAGRTLLVTAEDSARIVSYRLKTLIGAWTPSLANIHVLDVSENNGRLVNVERVSDREGTRNITRNVVSASPFLRALRQEMKASREAGHGFDLIVLDPLSRLAPYEAETDNGVAAQVLSKLQRLARDADAAVLVCHHTSKASRQKEGSAINAARGASALVDGARTLLLLSPAKRDDDDKPATGPSLEVAKCSHHRLWKWGKPVELGMLAEAMGADASRGGAMEGF